MRHPSLTDLDRQIAEDEAVIRPLVQDATRSHEARESFVATLGCDLRAASARPPGRLPRPLELTVALRVASPWQGRVMVAAALAVALAGAATLGTLVPRFTTDVNAAQLLAEVQKASIAVPAGQVQHVVTTYTMNPPIDGSSTHTLEQWFGNDNGQQVSHQTDLMGTTSVVDATGTGWVIPPQGNQVLKLPSGTVGKLPLGLPGPAALSDLTAPIAGAQPRVTGQTTVNGQRATTVEVSLPLPQVGVGLPATPGAAATTCPSPAPNGSTCAVGSGGGTVSSAGLSACPTPTTSGNACYWIARSKSGGAPPALDSTPPSVAQALFAPQGLGTFVTVPPSGIGSIVADLTVDSETYQILEGHIVSKDQSGNVVGTTDWTVATDELLPLASVPSDLFTFTPPVGATVTTVQPGQPITIRAGGGG